MLSAFALALGDLFTPAILRIFGKSLVVTLIAFVVIGLAAWFGLRALIDTGIGDAVEGFSGFLAAAGAILMLWMLWTVIAFAVIQLFADQVIAAVEARHYPAAYAEARPLGFHGEVLIGLKTALYALIVNLIALPLALLLLITGIGAVAVFWAANALVLGRELMEMVWLRHRASMPRAPLSRGERLIVGGIPAALLLVPLANLVAPVLGAAMATHLVHRKRSQVRAD
ncbi:MAG: EI24 domain-containing protein [Novosphingobium sp.]|nr:EI24 domain-containing protein [Novosphingobium sp.]